MVAGDAETATERLPVVSSVTVLRIDLRLRRQLDHVVSALAT